MCQRLILAVLSSLLIAMAAHGQCGPGAGTCCSANGTPGCEDIECCELICSLDPFCCNVGWGVFCGMTAQRHCAVCGGTGPACGTPGTGDCCASGGNGTPFCENAACCESVCDQLPHCCETEWDGACSALAASICGNASNCNPNSCQFFCGSQAPGGCWCDEPCFAFKDCCNGVCFHCPAHAPCTDPTNNSCVAFCGGQAPGGCWCDKSCPEPGSFCCPDICEACNEWWCPDPPHPADLNGDGVINVFDLLILLAHWGECSPPGPCTGDLTGDRHVDVADLLILLENWG